MTVPGFAGQSKTCPGLFWLKNRALITLKAEVSLLLFRFSDENKLSPPVAGSIGLSIREPRLVINIYLRDLATVHTSLSKKATWPEKVTNMLC